MKNVGILGIIVLVLGLGTINIQHHLNIPDELKSSAVIHKSSFVDMHPPFLHTRVDVQLADEIKGYNSVRFVEQLLQQAQPGDVVVMHLTGYGGQVNTVLALINNVNDSKAHVIMKVEAPVYSGHAYLALSGAELQIDDNAYVMLHTSSGIDEDCNKATGFDRGVSNQEHCQRMKDADMRVINNIIDRLPYVSPAEKIDIKTGHSVYISSQTIKQRMK